MTPQKKKSPKKRLDAVERASDDSFPASDPPAWTKTIADVHLEAQGGTPAKKPLSATRG